MQKQFVSFLIRWGLNSLGLFIAVKLLGSLGAEFTGTHALTTFLIGGFLFSIVNAVLKPIIVILSLPAILLTLGLFMLIVNGFMVYLSVLLTPGLKMTFIASILAGIIMGLVNYIVTATLDFKGRESRA